MKFLILLAAVLLAVNAEYPSATAFRSALDVAPWITNYLENSYLGAKVTGVFVTTLEVENTTRYIEFNDYVFPTDLCVHVMLRAEVQDEYLPKSAGGFKIFYEVSVPVHINIPDSSDETEDSNESWVCPALAVQCPDGSFAGLAGPDCKPNCPEEQPKGNLTYWEVANVAENYLNAYGAQEPIGIQLSLLAFEDLSQQMPLNANETMEDNCIVVYFFSSTPNHVIPTPTVYQGVRMFYKQQPDSPKLCTAILRVCADGSLPMIGPDCIQTCPPTFAHSRSSGMAGTVLIIVVISLLSCCICCCRACKRRCNKKNGFQRLRPASVLPNTQVDEAGYYYPAEQFAAAQQQEFSEHQMPPMMMMPAPGPYPMMPHPGMMPPPPFPVMVDQDGNNVMPPHPFFHPMFGPMIATPAGFMMVPPPPPHAQEPSQQ